jgi:hypothetical protein
MKIQESKFKVRNQKSQKISISTLVDQSKYTLIGGVFSDENGKIHFVELVHLPTGQIVPDYPVGIKILDVKQVGVSF